MTAVRKAVERMSAEQSKVAAGECEECLSQHGGRCTIVCLANSRKYGRHCIAGVCERRRAWVRPISALSDGSLPAASILVGGEQPKLLQAVLPEDQIVATDVHQVRIDFDRRRRADHALTHHQPHRPLPSKVDVGKGISRNKWGVADRGNSAN